MHIVHTVLSLGLNHLIPYLRLHPVLARYVVVALVLNEIRGLRPLVPTFTTMSAAREALGLPEDAMPVDRVHKASPGPERDKERSRFFDGIANAMARQWGGQAMQDYLAAA